MRRSSQRRPFTLLEIIVAITLIALIAPIFLNELSSNIKHWKFANTSSFVQEELEKLQQLTLIYQIDTSFEFYKEKGSYYLKVDSEEPIKGVKKGTFHLDGIQEILIRGKLLETESLKGNLYSSGKHRPREVIEFRGSNKKDIYKLDIKNLMMISKVN